MIHKAYFKGGHITHTFKKKGRGMGSVLLDGGEGGYGGGSSYSSLDDYINTTGLNPNRGEPSGRGLGKMNSKLEHLLIKTKKGKKEKNITFSL
jgi:hypothetical protein